MKEIRELPDRGARVRRRIADRNADIRLVQKRLELRVGSDRITGPLQLDVVLKGEAYQPFSGERLYGGRLGPGLRLAGDLGPERD